MSAERDNFDAIAGRLAEVIDDAVSTVPRDRQRRVELIGRQVRHALNLGYKAARRAVDLLPESDGRARDA